MATEVDDLSAECAVKNVKSNLAEDDVIGTGFLCAITFWLLIFTDSTKYS